MSKDKSTSMLILVELSIWRQQYNIMMANYRLVVQILQKMDKPQYVKMVEAELEKMQDDPAFLGLFGHAIKDKNLSGNTRLAASITLNQSINRCFQKLEENSIVDILLNIILDDEVEFKYKHALQSSLVSVLELAEQSTINRFYDIVNGILADLGIIQPRNGDLQHGRNVIQILQNKSLCLKKLRTLFFVYDSIKTGFNQIVKLLSHLNLTISNTVQFLPVVKDDQTLVLLGEMATFYTDLISNVNSSNVNEWKNMLRLLSMNTAIVDWIISIYSLQTTPNKQHWISTDVEQLHTDLGLLKSKAAELHVSILTIIIGEQRSAQINSMIVKHIHYTVLIMNTLNIYAGFSAQLEAYQSFVVGLLKILQIYLRLNPQFFSQIYINLLHTIVFPLLLIKQQQMKLFQEDPQGFNELLQDCCQSQKFGIVKTEAASLLEIVCDQEHASAEYVIQHCILSLKIRLGLDQNFDRQAPNFLPIQAALVVLCINSYRLHKHLHEMIEIKKILDIRQIVGRISNIELSRFFSFLAYNYLQIYSDPLEGSTWINLALSSDHHPTVEISALDFIKNVAEQYFSVEFLVDFARRSLKKGTMYIANLLKMICFHSSKVPEQQMVTIVQIIYQIAQQQLQDYQKRQKAHTMDFVSCLHMIRKIVQSKKYCIGKPYLKKSIWNFFKFMPRLVKISLEDQLIRIVIAYINEQEQISEQVFLTFQPIVKLYTQDREDCGVYYIYFGTLVMKANCKIALALMRVLPDSFMKLRSSADGTRNARLKVNLGNILIILQNIVALHGTSLGEQNLNFFINFALSITPQGDEPQDRTDHILIARSLNLLLLCYMHHKKDIAFKRLLMFQDSPIFCSYDLKVYAACIGKEIFRQTDVVSVTSLMILLIKAMTSSQEDKISFKSNKNPYSLKVSSTKIKIKRIEDHQNLLKHISTPFQLSTAQEQLRRIIQTMKANNPCLYDAIIKSLPSSIYESLKKLVSQVVVEGKKRKIAHYGAPKQDSKLSPMDTQAINRDRKRIQNDKEDQQDLHQEELQSKKAIKHKKKFKADHQKQRY